jgi:hypothetical protein
MKTNWFKRRWFDFRMGHGTYLSFLLSFTNFLLISYNFLVSQVPFLQQLFPSILEFAVLGAVVYIPLAIYIGHWHNTKQLGTDITVQANKNPYYQILIEKLDRIEQELKK